jgi:kinesin family protein 2/24
VFAYGQTGSGKTYTMEGLQSRAITDIFRLANTTYKNLNPQISLSFYEIYGQKTLDLMNNKKELKVLEDSKSCVQIKGLEETIVENESELQQAIEYGNSVRTTHAT